MSQDMHKLEKLLDEKEWYIDIGVAEYRLVKDERGYLIVDVLSDEETPYASLDDALVALFELIGVFTNKP